MYNSFTRIQNVFGSATTVALVLAGLIAVSDLFLPRSPSGTIKLDSAQVAKGRSHLYSRRKEDFASVRFSLEADLSSLFASWNTKSVIVYVTAEWPPLPPPANASTSAAEAVVWDLIVTSPTADHLANLGPATLRKLKRSAQGKSTDPSRGLLKLTNQKAKYRITHPSGKMADVRGLRLRLNYNVQPWIGLLTWNQRRSFGRWHAIDGGLSKPFDLPSLHNEAANLPPLKGNPLDLPQLEDQL